MGTSVKNKIWDTNYTITSYKMLSQKLKLNYCGTSLYIHVWGQTTYRKKQQQKNNKSRIGLQCQLTQTHTSHTKPHVLTATPLLGSFKSHLPEKTQRPLFFPKEIYRLHEESYD